MTAKNRLLPAASASVLVSLVAVLSPAGAADGKAVYEKTCMVCHATGVANAPKLADKAAWKDRIAKGIDTLYTHSLKGFNAMPPKGGNMGLSDADVKAAVDYMVSQAK